MAQSTESADSRTHKRRSRVGATVLATAVLGASLLIAVLAGPAQAATTDHLTPGMTLAPNAALTSVDGRFKLYMQGDGNLVQYGNGAARWSSNTFHAGSTLYFQTDGNLVVYDRSMHPMWASGTYGAAKAAVFYLQADGNEVAYATGMRAVWASGTLAAPSSAGPFVSPSGRFRAGMQADGNFVLISLGSASPDAIWGSGTYGHPMAFLALQADGNLVIYDHGRALWATGTSGHPGATVALQNDGNLVLYVGHTPLWSTGTAGVGGNALAGDPQFRLVWSHSFNDGAAPPALSSPGLAVLDGGGPAAIIGDRAGFVYAYHLSDGSAVSGWPTYTGAAVDSTPSVLGSGSAAQVFVGLGTAGNPQAGGIVSLNANGGIRWRQTFAAAPAGGGTRGVQGSVAIGSLQTAADVISGSMGQEQYAFTASGGQVLSGFPWFEADSNFTTPAIANLYGTGNVIVEGGDSSAGNALGVQYSNGGHIRILSAAGHGSSASQSAGLSCDYRTNQVMQSSPAVGPFLAGGGIGIVAGTGTYWPGASDTNTVIAINANCALQWQTRLDGSTASSPALINATGSGLQVIQAVTAGSVSAVYALNGANGAVLWRTPLSGAVFGSVTSIDLGGGHQSLLVPTSTGVYVLDGRTGADIGTLVSNVGDQNTAMVSRDPNGTIGVTVAGYSGPGGVLLHFELIGSNVATVSGPGQWPMFHHDPQLTGVGR